MPRRRKKNAKEGTVVPFLDNTSVPMFRRPITIMSFQGMGMEWSQSGSCFYHYTSLKMTELALGKDSFSETWSEYRFSSAEIFVLRPDRYTYAICPFAPDLTTYQEVLQVGGHRTKVIPGTKFGFDVSRWPLSLFKVVPVYDMTGAENQFVSGWVSTKTSTDKVYLAVSANTESVTGTPDLLVKLTLELRGLR